jgi:subtilisin-like proprotein convertase family protein
VGKRYRTVIINVSLAWRYGVRVNVFRWFFLSGEPARRPVMWEAVEPRLLLNGGTIRGVAWNDLNGDGIEQPGEPLLSGWVLFLDDNHNNKLDAGEISTTTNADGTYAFTNIAPGNYLIGEVTKPGWKQTYPTAVTVATPAATTVVPDAISGSIDRSADTSQYDAAELNTASGWVVGIGAGTNVASVVAKTGATGATASGALPDAYVLHFPTTVSGSQAMASLGTAVGISFYYPLVARAQDDRSVPNDPLFPQQWNLNNTLPGDAGLPGADADVESVWDKYQGNGVTVAVVDNGVQYTHPDIAPNYDAADSYDFDDNDPDPMAISRDAHGTAVAGIVGARGNNGIGISGVAPQVNLAAIRLTDIEETDQQEAEALSYHSQTANPIDIYSNSWGPEDNGKTLEGPGPLALGAIKDSITDGRGGKGSIYVWAAGNGLQNNDNVNYDGYANSRYVIATTALDDAGKQAYYAEPGTPILISASGGGVKPGITTTDLRGTGGYNAGGAVGNYTNDYYNNFGGTSASAPMVAGVVALMLQANPSLTWRDVKTILLDTAVKNDPNDPGWVKNGAQHWVNDKYGFGAVDAAAAVQAAVSWTNLPAETSATSGPIVINQTIPDNSTTGLTSSVYVDRLMKVETVEVVFDATHPTRGDLRVVLTSPDGTQSLLAAPHNDSDDDYDNWTFTTTHDWDEISKGTWTLKVTDEKGGNVGTWNSWKLNIYGTNETSEQFVSLEAGAVANGWNFGVRPLPGARVVTVGVPFQSGPMRLIYSFDKDVGASISADDLELRNTTTGQVIAASLTHVDYTAGNRAAVWTFPGFAHGTLPDGNYTARLKASQITIAGGGMLDGNGDGLGGDDYISTFFQLKGDANHDRNVDAADLKILLGHMGSTNATVEQGDLNYDGKVDFSDFQVIELAYGNSLPPPVATGPLSSPAQTAPLVAAKPVLATPKASAAMPPAPVPVAQPLFSTQPIRRKPMDF